MTLIDTGPLVALLDEDDQHHNVCRLALRSLTPGVLMTTWPCFTEAMHLLNRVGGYRYKAALWNMYKAERLVLADLTHSEIERMAVLMEKYQDAPMDLADASLVALAESRSLRRVFTTDGHFRIYRLPDGSALEMIP